MHKDVWIIIPVYNEGKVVKDVVNNVSKHFSNVVCVNDGSTDNSGEEIKKTDAYYVEHPINLGQGAALQTGLDYALQYKTAKYFVTFDSDGQHGINDAIKMLEYIKKHNVDIVLGSRFLGKAENISGGKKMFLRLATSFSSRTTGVKLTDAHVGLRVLNRKFASNLKLTLFDFTHASEIIHRIGEGGYTYAEVPITVTYSDYSKDKGQPMLNAINITFDLFFHRISKR
jgi:glycosyltransferase involved in cell wall biosynthesis